ncbi:response regulator transcription factor [Rhizobium ruizarguesonis]|uniref:Response regulator transcription factor n=1 Tax=Rhizobium ruizarguesonis TaxID=2081791 RepID=A0AB38HQU8_9HYPH|nr:response regulator transcription factor [Rhizobium ruizarguesonis]TBC01444.1 response regulator transcription factor [Rhizobium ruizarguesonis]
MYILVVEDQQDIIEMLRLTWSDSRDKLEYISSVAQARRYIESNETSAYDCMIIDINLPDGSGLELLREARLRSEIPVVMISGAGDADSRADAISVGADDYLMKPFSVKELRARVHRLYATRQSARSAQLATSFFVGRVVCDLQRLLLERSDMTVSLTALEARILQVLHNSNGADCPKSSIARQALFREYDPRDKTIDVYINRLRGKLGELDDRSADAIKTVRGVGYRLIGR